MVFGRYEGRVSSNGRPDSSPPPADA
jgi:hypothetical protein